ncbi:hypothetical protein C0Q70_16384 [Pomacea canaliculata]|uniref:P-type domain-containing protein n=1 Tax=Pomacea canaliculata TaxID=400727 RepID=A0A2T7NPM8_POMCA|nr:hypothetical protein C0Q70_16384 [Pomacea canaliculata]
MEASTASQTYIVNGMSVDEAAVSRIDCWPERQGGVDLPTADSCQKRGCLYQPHTNPTIPACFFPQQNYGYRFVSMDLGRKRKMGLRVHLRRVGTGPFGDDLPRIVFTLEDSTFDTPDQDRFTVPLQLNLPTDAPRDPKYRFEVTSNDTFSFQIVRRSSGAVLFDTSVGGFVFDNQFLQLSTRLPTPNVYGIGENIHQTFRRNLEYHTYPMFGRDQPTKTDDTLTHYYNHYGVHPFYTCVEKDGSTHGVLILNSSPQDYTFTPLPMLTYRTIGGVLDFYVFLGPNTENVVQQYTAVIGRPYMPPYWALGFQLCKYGYNSLENLKIAVDRTREAGIPHDVQYVDIDHMSERRDFTIDNTSFAGLPQYFDDLRKGGMRTIIILDPALISNNTDYEPYLRFKAVDGFIKWPSDSNYTYPADSSDDGAIQGYVWPQGKTVYPDFFRPETQRVWQELIVEHRERIAFDGLWIDMNEPAAFGTNDERPFNWPEDVRHTGPSSVQSVNSMIHLIEQVAAAYSYDTAARRGRLSDKTICLTSVQGDRVNTATTTSTTCTGGHRHPHPTVGPAHTTLSTAHIALRTATGERGIVVSRSTFVGSGRYAAHWLGDNMSSWNDLRASVVGIQEFNLFGIPFTGADICGHFDSVTTELCKRWMQLGAFYTFSRNHNAVGNRDQDPGSFDEETSRVSREAMETRYWLLPYVYTLFHKAHTEGGTVIRPLHHEYPTDQRALENSRQFLWGSALLISPVLDPNVTSLTYYVPPGRWYDYYTGEEVTSEGGYDRTVPVKSDSRTELLLSGGSILPLQAPARNTTFSRKNPFTLLVALDNTNDTVKAKANCSGMTAVSVDTFETGNYYKAEYLATEYSVSVQIVQNNIPQTTDLVFEEIKILGVKPHVQSVDIVFQPSTAINPFSYSWQYVNKTQTLLIQLTSIPLPLSASFSVQWRSISDEDFARVDCWPERQGRGQWVFTSNHLGQNIRLSRIAPGPFGNDLENVIFSAEEHGDDVFRFTFTTEDGSRYKVPKVLSLPNQRASQPKYKFEVTSTDPFAFRIIRNSTGTVIFDTSVGGLVLEDQFLQLSTRLPTSNIYGIGENVHSTFKRTYFGTESNVTPFSTLQNHFNHYGVHPFYTCVEDDGNTHGVLLLNSDPQDYTFTPLPMLTYRTIGGVLDFYAIGRPFMPPYWALGFQLCKYGYNSLENLKIAVDRTREAGIPHDVQYADIDHMSERRDFTIDNSSFAGLTDYFRQLRDGGMRTIIILDPALVSNYTNYEPYERMKAVNGFIMWPNDTNYIHPADSDDDGAILGYVWPQGKTVFPDFFKTQVQDVWQTLITEHRRRIDFDGLWIDMNEPAVFGTNDERPFNWPEDVRPYWSLKCPVSKLDDPPYRTAAAYSYDTPIRSARLSDKTLCLTSVQGQQNQYRHYDVHNLYGWSQTPSTLRGLRAAIGNRGIVVTRSTFVGSNQYAGHWLGDNFSGWDDLRASIIGIQEFNLFGFTYTGADICGHFDTASAELCKRWMQLGAFYTFSRNHNAIGNRDQDPGNFDEEVKRLSREAMETRYWLLPYLYTLMHQAHVYGGTVIRPLHHEFPTDLVALNINSQFLWGAALLISPIIYPNATELIYYIPQGRWYDFYTPAKPLKLLVALSNDDTSRGVADGTLFWDDGLSIDTYENGNYFEASFRAESQSVRMTVLHNHGVQEVENLVYNTVEVWGVPSQVRQVRINSVVQPESAFTYDAVNKVLRVHRSIPFNAAFIISWQ